MPSQLKTKSIQHLVFDSDGVLTNGGQALKGAIDLIAKLNEIKFPYHILTNNPFLDAEVKSVNYRKMGFEISPEHIVGAADPLPKILKSIQLSSNTVYSIGETDPHEHLQKLGLHVDNNAKAEELGAIILFDHDYAWDNERVADLLHILIQRPELPLIACNPDLVFPDYPGHLMLTTGAWVDMLQRLCHAKGIELKPIYLGKPYAPIYEHLTEKLPSKLKEQPEHIFMMGDSPGTDILGANQKGWSSVLLETGNYLFGKDLDGAQADITFSDLEAFSQAIDKGQLELKHST